MLLFVSSFLFLDRAKYFAEVVIIYGEQQSDSPEVCRRHAQYVNDFQSAYSVASLSVSLSMVYVWLMIYSEEAEDVTRKRHFAFEESENSTCTKQ